MLLDDIAKHLNLEIVWPNDTKVAGIDIHGVAPIDSASEGSITFLSDAKYAKHLEDSKASALITRSVMDECKVPQLVHKDPHFIFAKTSNLFYKVDHGPQGVSDKAEIHADAKLGKNLTIYPFVYIAEGAEIGDDVVLYPGVFVGKDAVVGSGSVLHANNVIGERCVIGKDNLIHAGCVIGADGFGFAAGEGQVVKIPQTGIAKTGDNVELGGCCTIDRAVMGETLVKSGTKFDSKVHIGHNSVVGENCMFSAMTAVAGSSEVGNWCLAGGQAAIGGHIKIGNGVKIGAKAGVINSVEDGKTVMGFPAQDAMKWRRSKVFEKKMPEFDKKVKAMEKRLVELEAALAGK